MQQAPIPIPGPHFLPCFNNTNTLRGDPYVPLFNPIFIFLMTTNNF